MTPLIACILAKVPGSGLVMVCWIWVTALSPLDNPQEKGSVFTVDTLNPGVALLTKEPSTSSGLRASAGMGGHVWVPVQTH